MQQHQADTQGVDLRQSFGVIGRHKWSIALVTILVTGLALGLVYRREPLYTSTSRLEVRPLFANSDLQGGSASLLATMETEAQRVTSQPILARAKPALEAEGLRTDDASVAKTVGVTVPANTTFLDISCTEPSPLAAKTCADAFADAYKKDRQAGAQASYVAEQSGPLKAKQEAQAVLRDPHATPAEKDSAKTAIDTANLQLLAIPTPSPSPAIVSLPGNLPVEPSNKDYIATGALGLIMGLALGVGLAFLRERMDQRVAGRASLEEAVGAPVLAVVPHVKGWRKKRDTKLVTISASESPPAEAYRTARTTLLYLAGQRGMQVVMVTGPGAGEGKTTTAANLAASLAQAGQRVVAISCDLRKPRLHRFFGVDNDPGLSNLLRGEVGVADVVQKPGVPNLLLIPSGPGPDKREELLGSPFMGRFLKQLRGRADFVILDTAPALVVADSMALAPFCDGVIVVADASKTTHDALTQLRHQFEGVGAHIVGAILNNLDPKDAGRYPSFYRSHYSTRYVEPAPSPNGSENGRASRGRPSEPRTVEAPPAPPMVIPDSPPLPPVAAPPRTDGADEEMWR